MAFGMKFHIKDRSASMLWPEMEDMLQAASDGKFEEDDAEDEVFPKSDLPCAMSWHLPPVSWCVSRVPVQVFIQTWIPSNLNQVGES